MTDELEVLARRAFLALGLRDYARFDVRLSPGAGGEATGGDMAWPEGRSRWADQGL